MFKTLPTKLQNEFRFLFLINIFGIALVFLRHIVTGGHFFYFLGWNLFLGAIPYGITLLMQRNENLKKGFIFMLLAFLWLLFLPNAPYIVTDLMHLSYTPYRWLWFDVIAILTFAISGLAFGFFSLQSMSEIVIKKYGNKIGNVIVSVTLFASAFGVYLGRFQRFNSWDIIHHPGHLMLDIANRFVYPLDHPRTWGMTLIVGLFLHILFYGIKRRDLSNSMG